MAEKVKYVKRYKCPYCEKRYERNKLANHIDKVHPDMIPEGYTASRVAFNYLNKKTCGHCIICHEETAWNEDKKRYERLCGKQSCHDEYVRLCNERLENKTGKTKEEIMKDPEHQEEMLKRRSISGTYRFSSGGQLPYVGQYEKNFLHFMDNFLHVKVDDILAPGVTVEYYYNGEKHFWITDFYYIPYNLVIDIKDGGDNPNNREMPEYRAKQLSKEKAITELNKYNYIRLTDNKFEQLFDIMFEIKESLLDLEEPSNQKLSKLKPIIRINEGVLSLATSASKVMARAIEIEGKISTYNANNPISNTYDLIKNKHNPAIVKITDESNDLEELTYLQRYLYLSKMAVKRVRDRIKQITYKGKSATELSFYSKVTRDYIDRGITVKDCDICIQTISNDMKHIKEKKKDIKKNTKKYYKAFARKALGMTPVKEVFADNTIERVLRDVMTDSMTYKTGDLTKLEDYLYHQNTLYELQEAQTWLSTAIAENCERIDQYRLYLYCGKCVYDFQYMCECLSRDKVTVDELLAIDKKLRLLYEDISRKVEDVKSIPSGYEGEVNVNVNRCTELDIQGHVYYEQFDLDYYKDYVMESN